MQKTEQLYEGKAKKVWATDDPEIVIVDYKDDACLLYTSPSPRDPKTSRMPSSA